MSIKQSRKLNIVSEDGNTVIKEIREGQQFYENEVHALQLLTKHVPRLISASGSTIVTEKVLGKHLSDVVMDTAVIIKLAQALNYIHGHKKGEKSLIHGDLHKDNIFIDDEQTIKFIDFTCAEYSDPLIDAAAVEIHITQDPELLEIFYQYLEAKYETEKVDEYKLQHCRRHLEWAEAEGFTTLAQKSKTIINEILEKRERQLTAHDFDFLGVFTLQSITGVEEFVTPLDEYAFLSRNSSYYQPRTCSQAADKRDYLDQLLPASGKRGLVIAEHMLNASCRVYYAEFKHSLLGVSNQLQQVRTCLDLDVANVVRLLEGQIAIPTKAQLPRSENPTFDRQIEADHKYILYQAIKKLPKQNFVVSPLLGGLLIGPFFKAIHGDEYSHVVFGLHDQDSTGCINQRGQYITEVNQVIPASELARIPKSLIIFDDNIGTGETLKVLKNTFSRLGHQSKVGAIEMSWGYYDQVITGTRNSQKFDFRTIDFPTYQSTRHHTITESLIASLALGAQEYQQKLKAYGFRNPFLADDELLYFRGRSIAEKYGCAITGKTKISNLILSVDIMDRKIRYLENFPVDQAIEIIYDYPEVNIIDIDRYQGQSANIEIIKKMLTLRVCRVGGGIRTRADIEELLLMGAKKVIVGTHASESLLAGFPKDRIVVAIDSLNRATGQLKDVAAEIRRFEPYCNEFQYVCVETDGKAMGGDIQNAIKYSKLTNHIFNCVGGIAYRSEMELLAQYNIGCVVGRAIQDGYFS